jgi:hypothetical protein
MNRRDLPILSSTATYWPQVTRAQQKPMPVNGIVGLASVLARADEVIE